MLPMTEEAARLLGEKARAPSADEREKAIADLFAAFRSSVFALCLHVTGGRADAEDALQDCFVAVYRGLAGFRGEARLSTWVYRIAVRSALATKARRPHTSLVDGVETPSAEAGPEDLAASRQQLRKLDAALERLSSEHRVVLSLFALDGLDHAEIAAILGVPAGTVWSRLHLARKRLNALLAEGPP